MRPSPLIVSVSFLFSLIGAGLSTYGAYELAEARRVLAVADVVLLDAQQQNREASRLN